MAICSQRDILKQVGFGASCQLFMMSDKPVHPSLHKDGGKKNQKTTQELTNHLI